jgi:organic hydroperoxide reductase OsmC/OhrA
LLDEPPPLGKDRHPNPARILAAAIGSCLSASLLFCLRRAKLEPKGLSSNVELELVRNDRNRLRVGRVDVTLHPELDLESGASRACLEAFEDFCVVTQSVRDGIDVHVRVEPAPAKDELRTAQ